MENKPAFCKKKKKKPNIVLQFVRFILMVWTVCGIKNMREKQFHVPFGSRIRLSGSLFLPPSKKVFSGARPLREGLEWSWGLQRRNPPLTTPPSQAVVIVSH